MIVINYDWVSLEDLYMKKIKSFTAMLLCCAALLSATAFAANSPIIRYTPRATSGISSCTNSFDLNTITGVALYSATTMGTSSATKVMVSSNVQRLEGGKWTDVSGTYLADSETNSPYILVQGSKSLAKGYYYRLESLHTAYVGGTKYTETMHSNVELYK